MFAGLPPAYVALWFGSVVNRLGLLVVPMLTFYLQKKHHFTLTQAGAVVALFGLGQACASLLGGQLADRIGRKATMLFALVGGGLLMLVFGSVQDPRYLAPLAFLVALVTETYRPAVFSIVADIVPPAERMRAYSLMYVAVNLGFAVAPALAGVLAQYDYRWLFYGNAAANLLFAGIVLRFIPETKPERLPDAPAPTAFVAVLRDRAFMLFALCGLLVALVAHQGGVSLAGTMAAQGHNEATYGMVVGWNGLLIVLAQTAIAARIGHLAPTRLLAVGALLMGMGFFLHGQGTGIPLHLLAVTVWTVGEMLQAPTASTLVAGLAPADARGRYQGVYALSWSAAAFLGPLIGPRVIERFGAEGLFTGCLALGVVAAIAAWRLRGPLRARLGVQ